MQDRAINEHIGELVEEEHLLFGRSTEEGGLTDEEHKRLEDLQVQLDQCWDLLRQRRALRAAGHDPDEAHLRDAEVVEHYLQ